jgi:uncharacterized protein (DUF924 family)
VPCTRNISLITTLRSAKFGNHVEAIRSTQATADDILDAIKPSSPLDWLGIILLLDQMPRNSYRDGEAWIAFRVFDPLAQEVMRRAVAAGVLDDPAVRYRLAYRTWFCMPFMHSEDVEMHRLCARMFEDSIRDMEALVEADERSVGGDVRACRAFLKDNLSAAKEYVMMVMGFEKRHQVIIEQFGRYPHRNTALGRESTSEEEAYLRDGGETFAG